MLIIEKPSVCETIIPESNMGMMYSSKFDNLKGLMLFGLGLICLGVTNEGFEYLVNKNLLLYDNNTVNHLTKIMVTNSGNA